MTRRVLYYLIADALADLRAWLWSWYGDPTETLEVTMRTALRRLGK